MGGVCCSTHGVYCAQILVCVCVWGGATVCDVWVQQENGTEEPGPGGTLEHPRAQRLSWPPGSCLHREPPSAALLPGSPYLLMMA